MLALAVYPEARVDVEATGVVLHPSAPAVLRAEAKRIGLGYAVQPATGHRPTRTPLSVRYIACRTDE